MPRTPSTHAVVVGAGFAGLTAARELTERNATTREHPVRVTVVDRHNYHTFQPLLYQVATAGLNPQDVGANVRGVFRRRKSVRFRLGAVTGHDPDAREIGFADGGRLSYDHLVIAAGAITNDFGIPGVAEHTFPLKSIAEAVALRNHVLAQFEHVDRDPSLLEEGALRFVVSGAGPTGVELAGALVELIGVLRGEFRAELLDHAEVVLVEMLDTVLPPYHGSSQRYTRRWLERHGVRLELGTPVERVEPDRVVLEDGRDMLTRTPIWVAGVRANPLAEALGLPVARGGRVIVEPDLRVAGFDDVYAIGDVAAALAEPAGWRGPGTHDDGPELLPQLAPVAIQQGHHVGAQIHARLGGRPTEAFHYTDKGTMATVGRAAAVAELPRGIRIRGFPAWLAWLALHLYYLIGYRNRLAVLLSWAWNYLTYDQSTRLMIGPSAGRGDLARDQEDDPVRWSA